MGGWREVHWLSKGVIIAVFLMVVFEPRIDGYYLFMLVAQSEKVTGRERVNSKERRRTRHFKRGE